MISLVIPFFNERDALRPLSEEVTVAMRSLGEEWEAILVDDGSTDGSTDVAREIAESRNEFKLVKLRRNFGKSAALMAGFCRTRGDRVVTLDADLQDDPAEIGMLLARLDEGYDLVSGWKRERHDPLGKRLPSALFNRVTSALSGVKMHDFNCGLKAYRGDLVRTLNLYGELHRYVPVLGSYRGWRVTEMPVNHRKRLYGESKFGAERFLRGLFDLLTVLFLGRYQHRPLHLFGGVGSVMMLAGSAILAYLAVLKIGGAAIGQRPLLTLGVLLVVVGIQVLSLGLISDMITSARADSLGSESSRFQIEDVVDGATTDGQATIPFPRNSLAEVGVRMPAGRR